jgi:hypothetical protein
MQVPLRHRRQSYLRKLRIHVERGQWNLFVARNIHLHAPMRLSATPEGQSTRDMMAPTRSGDGQATFCKNSVVVCDANGKLTRDATDPFEQIYRGAVCCGLFATPLSRRPNRPTPVAYTASASPSQMS